MNQKQTPILHSVYYYIPPVILGIITTLVYMPSWHYAFQFDDVANIQKHFNLRHYTFFDLFFTGSRWISYWLNAVHYSIGKLDPFSYRVGNIIIHVTNGMLVFLIIFYALSRIKKATFFKQYCFSLALMTSALFLLHPVQTQTVSYVIQGELEGMATLFSLATIFMFLLYTNANTNISRSILVFCMYLTAFLSCGTKEITIVLPFLLALIDWCFVAQGSWIQFKQRAWLHLSIFSLIFTAYMYLLKPKFFYELFGLKMAVKNNKGNILTHHATSMITPGHFFISQFKVVLHYLWIFIWPFAISVEYDWKLSDSLFAIDCIVPLSILICISIYLFRWFKKDSIHPLCFGALWFIACIAPRSSFMPSAELLADYKTYLASVGWLFIIATAMIKAFEYSIKNIKHSPKIRLQIQTAFVLLLAMPLGYCTIQRNIVWSSGLEFWGDIIKNAPGKARAYNNYGVELAQNEDTLTDSIPYFQKAIAMDKYYSDPCNNLAVIYARTQKFDEAIEVFNKSLQITPNYPEGYNNLASIFIETKEYDKAKKALQRAIELRSHYGKAHYNLGRVYTAEGDHIAAWECYKKACMQGDLDTEAGFSLYAQSSFALQKFDDAICGYKKVVELNPNNYVALFRLGNSYYHTNRFTDALAWYQKAAQKQPHDSKVLFNIGETYAKLGQPEKAIGYYQKVQHETASIPQAGLRLAECYRSLGEHTKAQEILIAISKDTKTPDTIKFAALSMVDHA